MSKRIVLPLVVAAGCLWTVPGSRAQSSSSLSDFEQRFDEKRGQLQVGGPFVGVEFHHSRPAPSRISFYYPVANSIDLSTDYWKRDESMPMSLVISIGDRSDTLSARSLTYHSTPASVRFEHTDELYHAQVSYRFGESAPYMALSLALTNRSDRSRSFQIQTSLDLALRTSHTYATRNPSSTVLDSTGRHIVARFDEDDTGPTALFLASVEGKPNLSNTSDGSSGFMYRFELGPGQEREIVQVIGSGPPGEVHQILREVESSWRSQLEAYEERVATYAAAGNPFNLADTTLRESARWSMALLQADRHFIDGRLAPMPCPAQYNFFFTHDLLLTDLGAVNFDADRVRQDLLYLHSLAKADSVLPHAYYWKDGAFKTEFAGSDNWNHFWFVQLASSFLKHSGDTTTVARLWPMMTKSVRMMLENESDGLMHAERPDWWDIGHVYGARAYTTILAIRTLRAYVYAGLRLGLTDPGMSALIELAERMQGRLSNRLWDDEAGYLLNRIEGDAIDRHYYSGSLLGAAFGLMDSSRTEQLIETARRQLLDPKIGIRNAMPPDFHHLTELYRFQEGEVGDPYRYMNGGIWPQGTAWYVSALAAVGRTNEALASLKRYSTLEGIRQSPNGQPAFFEYRHADPHSPDYGRIDKTTFLWAGGFYLNALYQLLGVRTGPWNISFDPRLPDEFGETDYSVLIEGRLARIEIIGTGDYFRTISVDGRPSQSAVMTEEARLIRLTRGKPEAPYLASASTWVESVAFDADHSELEVRIAGIPGQFAEARFVSPSAPFGADIDNARVDGMETVVRDEGVFSSTLKWRIMAPESVVRIRF